MAPPRGHPARAALAALLLVLAPAAATASGGPLAVELPGSNPHPYAWIGYAVAQAGPLVAVSSPENTDAVATHGVVDVYECTPTPAGGRNCTLQTTLHGDDFARLFGISLAATTTTTTTTAAAANGTAVDVTMATFAVGALEAYTPEFPPGSLGALYIFECAGPAPWACRRAARLEPPAANIVEFGRAVAFFRSGLVVGAPYSLQQGAVLVYDCAPPLWDCRLRTQLISSSIDRDYFGWSVAADGDRIVVGSVGEDVMAGAAYLFECLPRAPGCLTLSKLHAVGRRPEDYFGWSVGLSGATVVASAPRALQPQGPSNFGSAHLFACAPAAAAEAAAAAEDGGARPYAWECVEQVELVADSRVPAYFADTVHIRGKRVTVSVEEGGHTSGSVGGSVGAGVYMYECDTAVLPWRCERAARLVRTIPVTVKYVSHYQMAVAVAPDAIAVGCFEQSRHAAQFVGGAFLFSCSEGTPRAWRGRSCVGRG